MSAPSLPVSLGSGERSEIFLKFFFFVPLELHIRLDSLSPLSRSRDPNRKHSRVFVVAINTISFICACRLSRERLTGKSALKTVSVADYSSYRRYEENENGDKLSIIRDVLKMFGARDRRPNDAGFRFIISIQLDL